MQYWLNIGFVELDQLRPIAVEAERMGFTGVTLPDHLFVPEQLSSAYPYSPDGAVTWTPGSPWPDCWTTIAALSQSTSTLRFMTGVYVAPLRDPFTLAKAAGTAAVLAGGRVGCGFGAGWMREEFEAVGVDFAARGGRFDEMLEILPLLWSGEMVEFHGRHFDFSRLEMRPAAGRVPILVGGNTAVAMRRAARCDGWIGAHTTLAATTEVVGRMLAVRAEAGRPDAPFEIMLAAFPRSIREAGDLEAAGVQALSIPVAALSREPGLADRLAGMERLAGVIAG